MAVHVLSRVGRGNRSKVKVRVVGNSSVSWVDAVSKWGGELQAVVVDNSQVTRFIKQNYRCPVLDPSQARKHPPHEPWHGIAFATVRTLKDRLLIADLFEAWLPGEFVIVAHGSLSRRETMELVPQHTGRYRFKVSRARHSDFGGATTTIWNVIHLSRLTTPITAHGLMTKEHYPQPLQASLDDTEGATGEKVSFDACFGQDYLGTVTLRKHPGTVLRVYDADGLGPDLSLIQCSRYWFFLGFSSVSLET